MDPKVRARARVGPTVPTPRSLAAAVRARPDGVPAPLVLALAPSPATDAAADGWPGTTLNLEPLYARGTDIPELIHRFAVEALEGCWGADPTERVHEAVICRLVAWVQTTQVASVAQLRHMVRELVFDACLELAQRLVDAAQNPAHLNEGLMELGALVCTPKNPACPTCPWANSASVVGSSIVCERKA